MLYGLIIFCPIFREGYKKGMFTFAKPFPLEFIIDILSNKIRVIIGLDLDLMIRTFNDSGIETSWMTTKKTELFKQKCKGLKFFEYRNKGIMMKRFDGKELCLLRGVFDHIFYDNFKPSSIAKILQNT